jgi:hypothetical protein
MAPIPGAACRDACAGCGLTEKSDRRSARCRRPVSGAEP